MREGDEVIQVIGIGIEDKDRDRERDSYRNREKSREWVGQASMVELHMRTILYLLLLF